MLAVSIQDNGGNDEYDGDAGNGDGDDDDCYYDDEDNSAGDDQCYE